MIRFAAALVLGVAVLPAWAQDDLAERKAVAAEYLGMSLDATTVEAMSAQGAGMLLAEIERRQPQLYAQKAERLNDLVTASMAQNMRDAMIGLDDDMAQVISLEELTALRDFYASSEGRSVMGKMPAFMAEVMPRIMQRSLRISGELMQDLEAEGVDVR